MDTPHHRHSNGQRLLNQRAFHTSAHGIFFASGTVKCRIEGGEVIPRSGDSDMHQEREFITERRGFEKKSEEEVRQG